MNKYNIYKVGIMTFIGYSLGLASLAGQITNGLNPYAPPSKNFNLSCWNLTLPVGKGKDPTVITTKQLTAGYQSQYFYTSSSDGSMVFWSPVTGATTKNTKNCRSELRETAPDGSGQLHNWFLNAGTAELSGQLSVTQVPSTGKVVVAQIHDTGIGTKDEPLIKLTYSLSSKTVYAIVRKVPSKNVQTDYILASNVNLNNKFSYVIKLTPDRMLSMTVNGKTKVLPIDPSWEKQTFYFKAGDYPQDSSGTITEGGRVEYFALNIVHQ